MLQQMFGSFGSCSGFAKRIYSRHRHRRLFDAFKSKEADIAGSCVDYLLQVHCAHTYRFYYDGLPSTNGYDLDSFECTVRGCKLLMTLPDSGLTCVSHANLGTICKQTAGELFGGFIESSINPAGNSYVGDPRDYGQELVEAHDLAIMYFLEKRKQTHRVPTATLGHLESWLGKCLNRRFYRNNWLLFRLLIAEVIEATPRPGEFENIMAMERGNGFFSDGPKGQIDYYSVWSFLYTLFWLSLVNPDRYADYFLDVLSKQLAWFDQFVGYGVGPPCWGRSLIYRHAIPLPHSLAFLLGHSHRIEQVNLFFEELAKAGGTFSSRVSQGFFEDSPRLVDPYSGPGGQLWGLRSLTPLLIQGDFEHELNELKLKFRARDMEGPDSLLLKYGEGYKVREEYVYRPTHPSRVGAFLLRGTGKCFRTPVDYSIANSLHYCDYREYRN